MALQPAIPQRKIQRPNITGSNTGSALSTGMFRNQGSGRRGGGGGGTALPGGGFTKGGVTYGVPGVGANVPGNAGSMPGSAMVAPGQAGNALMSGPTTYSAQNDPLLMENVGNIRKRMSADVETAQKQRAGADIDTATASEQKKLASRAARSGGGGALNEMAGDLADKAMRAKAGAMTDIGIAGQQRLDALTTGGQGIYAAPGQQNLAERGFLANVDAQKASQALQGAQLTANTQNQQFNQALETAKYLNPTPAPTPGGSYGGFAAPRAPVRAGGLGRRF